MHKKLIFALVSYSFCFSLPVYAQCVTNETGYINVSGEYICTVSCAGGINKSGYIAQNGNVLFITTEIGTSFGGNISGLTVYPNGKLSNNCNEIIWGSNASIWLRKYPLN